MKRLICLLAALLISVSLLTAGKREPCRAAEIDRSETVATALTEPEKTVEPMDEWPDIRGEDH